MTPIATPLRLAVIAAWTALLGFHVCSRVSAARGEERALSLASRVDRRASYDIVLRATDGERILGTCTVSCARADAGYRLTTMAALTDASFLPGLEGLLERFGAAPVGGARGTVTVVEEFDGGPWLRSIRIHAAAGAAAAHADADIGSTGMRLAWSVESGPEGRLAFPAFAGARLQGFQLVAALPADLAIGDRFSADLIGVDAATRAPTRRRAVFAVAAEEAIEVDGRTMLLDRVEVAIDGSPAGQAWCDRTGTVFVQRSNDLGIALELRRLERADGSVLWPRSTAP
jgi:hypothetical protein